VSTGTELSRQTGTVWTASSCVASMSTTAA